MNVVDNNEKLMFANIHRKFQLTDDLRSNSNSMNSIDSVSDDTKAMREHSELFRVQADGSF